MNREIPDVQAGSSKGRGTRDQIANICWIIEKQENSRKTSSSLTMIKPLTGSQQTGKFLKRWEYQTTLPASWETCMQVKKQQLKLDMEQWTSSKLGKEYVMAVYSHPIYLTYICRVHHAKRWAGWSTSWNQIVWRNINNHRYADHTILIAESEGNQRVSWWRWRRRVKKLA